jgi:pyruvate dehydrogenase E1 component beta subunit
MGAAMTGVPVIAEIMFSDFIAVCFDMLANEIAKSRYMTDGQVSFPLVVRTANGGGARFGAQHSQSVENWCMMIPGLKVVAPSTPADVVGLMAASIRDPDPVVFFEHKSLMATKADVAPGEIVDELGTAKVRREGSDVTIAALALMVPRALEAAALLAGAGISAEVIDARSLVPLDTRTILDSVARTGRFFTVEENPRLCGWGAEVVSIVDEEAFWDLDGPSIRITTPHIPLPAAAALEDLALPSVDRIYQTVLKSVDAGSGS